MEDSAFRPEDDVPTEATTSRKKRRGADFLSQYLFRRQQLEVSEADSDDEEEESDEKPRPRRKLFSNLFRNIVQPPKEPAVDQIEERSFDTSLWYGWQSPDRLPLVEPEMPDADISEAPPFYVAPEGAEDT